MAGVRGCHAVPRRPHRSILVGPMACACCAWHILPCRLGPLQLAHMAGAGATSARGICVLCRWDTCQDDVSWINHRLPIQLGSKVTSRISARAIRALLDGQQAAAQRDGQAGRSQAAGATAQGTPFVSTTERDVAAAVAASAASAPKQASASQAGPVPSVSVSAVSRSGLPGPILQPGSSVAAGGASQQPPGTLSGQEQPVPEPSPVVTAGSQRVPVAPPPTTTTQPLVNANAGTAPTIAPTVDVKIDQSGARRSVSLNGSTTPGKAPVRMIELSAPKSRTGSVVIERGSEKSEVLL